MSELENSKKDWNSVDDVRRVREGIARQHRGDFRAHRAETIRIFEEIREKLRVKVSSPAQDPAVRSGA